MLVLLSTYVIYLFAFLCPTILWIQKNQENCPEDKIFELNNKLFIAKQ